MRKKEEIIDYLWRNFEDKEFNGCSISEDKIEEFVNWIFTDTTFVTDLEKQVIQNNERI